jgi:amphiphysin
MQAVDHFALIAAHARESLLPDLEVIERRLVSPTADLVALLNNVKKLMVKRSHKLIDYDRHRDSVKKMKERTDRTVSDEKTLGKSEASLDQASREFNHFNTLLKQQLPILLSLKASFVDPCFQTLYWYQLRVHRTMLEGYQVLYDNANPSVINKSTTASASFEGKAEMQIALLEDLTLLTKNKLKQLHEQQTSATDDQGYYTASSTENSPETANPPNGAYNNAYNARAAEPPTYSAEGSQNNISSYQSNTNVTSSFRSLHEASAPSKGFQMPPFEPQNVWAENSSSATATAATASSVYSKPAPPPLAAKPGALKKYVVALYDYQAQADGDLSFQRDDRIEIVLRTNNPNDWWTGKLNGATGVFPANYVAEV